MYKKHTHRERQAHKFYNSFFYAQLKIAIVN